MQAHPDEKLGRACKPTQKKKKFLKMLQRSTKKTIKKIGGQLRHDTDDKKALAITAGCCYGG
ncbi:MAG: hypothetical protein KJ666_16275 [Bacteroidetes bacterium]|nr:hypothetical protein [Bacteroidota bacterium]